MAKLILLRHDIFVGKQQSCFTHEHKIGQKRKGKRKTHKILKKKGVNPNKIFFGRKNCEDF